MLKLNNQEREAFYFQWVLQQQWTMWLYSNLRFIIGWSLSKPSFTIAGFCRIFVEFVFKFLCKIYIYNRYIYSYITVIYKLSA